IRFRGNLLRCFCGDDIATGLGTRQSDLDLHVTRDKGVVGKYFPHAGGTKCVAEQDRVEDCSSGRAQSSHCEASFITNRHIDGRRALFRSCASEDGRQCPLYPQKRTLELSLEMSAFMPIADIMRFALSSRRTWSVSNRTHESHIP